MLKENGKNYAIKMSKGSVRKYPNVIWFPRSKTDPREIRGVLKLALKTQEENPGGFFNDKLLGEQMAQIGSINVVGLDGKKYIDSYEGKSIGDVSYITNARMLIRLFRFLGFVTRAEKGKYRLTDLGKLYCTFSGDFPDHQGDLSEESMLLESLSSFAFYCVNDDPTYRDKRFRVRPFVWLLYTLSLEPQCIYQLIVTVFASRSESEQEKERITTVLRSLRAGRTDLKKEWKKVGLNADDYSCVHNFYDSAKILVYLGMSLGLIDRTSNPTYGKQIAGRGRHLRQATVFYRLTEKGVSFLKKTLGSRAIFYDQLYDIFGDKQILQAVILLAVLNFHLGAIKIEKVRRGFFDETFEIDLIVQNLKRALGVEIVQEGDFLLLKESISFLFYQSVPPEILQLETVQKYYHRLMSNIDGSDEVRVTAIKHRKTERLAEFVPYFELDKERRYVISGKKDKELEKAIQYAGKEAVFGGQDRFSNRVSPTNSIVVENGTLYVDNSNDTLDLLVPLRLKDNALSQFIEENTLALIEHFLYKSDVWEKDQHYTWVRNCFRQFGMEAMYSGSGGMLARADVSVISPFVGGIEGKSPRENRGTVSTKAIRQAVDAKIQVADRYGSDLPRAAIAVGRRITAQAVKEEKKWSKEGQPILLLHDAVLHYLVLKSCSIEFSADSLVRFFTSNHGLVTVQMLMTLFKANTSDQTVLKKVGKELQQLEKYIVPEKNGD